MTDRLRSHDLHGPLIPLGPVALWLRHDPLGIDQETRFDFTVDLWHAAETVSQAIVRAPGRETPIKKGDTSTDYYGFGTSRAQALEEAESFGRQFEGANLDITVVTTLTLSPVLHDAKRPPFYHGAARMFTPPKWRWMVAATDQTIGDEFAREETVTIWRNGAATPEAATLQQTLDDLRAKDGAAHIRNGDLR